MNVVIIGGDAAGMSAAMQVSRKRKDASITVLEKGGIYSYAQCGLPYFIGGEVDKSEELIARPVSFFREKAGIDARVFHEVTAVDAENKQVSGTDLNSGEPFSVDYDILLVATGAGSIFPPFEGRDLEGIHLLKTIPDAEAIVEDLKENVLNVTVIGGGYIGLEVAENLVKDGRKVRIIDLADRIGNVYDKEISEKIQEEAERNGIDLVLGESVTSFEGENGRVSKVVTDQGSYNADMVVVAIGVKPNTGFLEGTGVHLHPSGAVLVNPYMETNIPGIYAAGDCATQFHRVKQKDDFVPLGTHANKQGRIAGINMSGETKAFKGITGSSVMQFFDLTVGKTGISENEAKELGMDYEVIGYDAAAIAHYMPGNSPLFIRMMKDKTNDKLIGMQAIGKKGVDKRIDVAATAIYHGMTTEDMENLDISYAPPFNTAWDPVQQGARRL
ncbi:FAD-dependent oxidoreductase [Salisediminibacterium selenitireducens]|uniref:FAD-dependent pyridine nucleotide-disulfide oxidoreductase n=1 Tax=Bacillus selenitireducens (strain ATCC 700615 / DSM 15326 / MLS10) TaxID=439292 RepID=D6Y0T8_BACIE|nr:FAD-dependent oxidoreductase [Salisediminibacterium selenitireducens]ADI00656.1 FAD-dependent pyridine nucleotide-disulfide oxidoreductase [[Bacillus] selenitireducens MLS10]